MVHRTGDGGGEGVTTVQIIAAAIGIVAIGVVLFSDWMQRRQEREEFERALAAERQRVAETARRWPHG